MYIYRMSNTIARRKNLLYYYYSRRIVLPFALFPLFICYETSTL